MIIGERVDKFSMKNLGMSDFEKKRNFPDDIIAEGVVPTGGGKPFRIREAALLVRRLGRPLTDEEMKQFED